MSKSKAPTKRKSKGKGAPATVDESIKEAVAQEVTPDQEEPSVEETEQSVLEVVEALEEQHADNLFQALVAAQSSVKAILRDKKHDMFGMYTSAENMVAVCRTVLNKFGLAATTAGDEISNYEGQLIKHNKYILGHESGETVEGSFSIPIEVIKKADGTVKGTYQDATLKADTIALSYYLRGVLQLPRYDHSKHQAALEPQAEYFDTPKPLEGSAQPASGAPKSSEKPALFMDDAKVDEIRKMIEATETDEGKMLAYYKVAGVSMLNQAQYNHLKNYLDTKLTGANIAAKTGGKVTKITMKEPAPEPTPVATLVKDHEKDQGSTQFIAPQFVNLIKQSLANKKKDEMEFLAKFVITSVEELPADQMNEAMTWIRS